MSIFIGQLNSIVRNAFACSRMEEVRDPWSAAARPFADVTSKLEDWRKTWKRSTEYLEAGLDECPKSYVYLDWQKWCQYMKAYVYRGGLTGDIGLVPRDDEDDKPYDSKDDGKTTKRKSSANRSLVCGRHLKL